MMPILSGHCLDSCKYNISKLKETETYYDDKVIMSYPNERKRGLKPNQSDSMLLPSRTHQSDNLLPFCNQPFCDRNLPSENLNR